MYSIPSAQECNGSWRTSFWRLPSTTLQERTPAAAHTNAQAKAPTSKISFDTAPASTRTQTPDLRISFGDGKLGRSLSFRGSVTKIRNRVSHSRFSSDDENDLDSGK